MLASDGIFDTSEDSTSSELRVLDLYAGSGALGFEAISRGAQSVVLVEHARPALAAIRDNTRALGVDDQVTVLAMPVERALRSIEGPFAVVILDPPYADVRERRFGEILALAAGLLSAEGVLVLEHASTDDPAGPPELLLDRRRKYGDTTVSLFRRSAPSV
jgi:16S rRNA (guanine966-N2)-methyltransferase